MRDSIFFLNLLDQNSRRNSRQMQLKLYPISNQFSQSEKCHDFMEPSGEEHLSDFAEAANVFE